jgi:hypothetical protein
MYGFAQVVGANFALAFARASTIANDTSIVDALV